MFENTQSSIVWSLRKFNQDPERIVLVKEGPSKVTLCRPGVWGAWKRIQHGFLLWTNTKETSVLALGISATKMPRLPSDGALWGQLGASYRGILLPTPGSKHPVEVMEWGNVTGEELVDALREVEWSSPPRPLTEFFQRFTAPKNYSKWTSRLKCNIY